MALPHLAVKANKNSVLEKLCFAHEVSILVYIKLIILSYG
jgi:hypothetical protein